MRQFFTDKRGASAVEFALISPFLLLLVAAILAYGSIFATSLSLQQLAAETARATIGGLNDTEREQLAEAYLAANEIWLSDAEIASHITLVFDRRQRQTQPREAQLRYVGSIRPTR